MQSAGEQWLRAAQDIDVFKNTLGWHAWQSKVEALMSQQLAVLDNTQSEAVTKEAAIAASARRQTAKEVLGYFDEIIKEAASRYERS